MKFFPNTSQCSDTGPLVRTRGNPNEKRSILPGVREPTGPSVKRKGKFYYLLYSAPNILSNLGPKLFLALFISYAYIVKDVMRHLFSLLLKSWIGKIIPPEKISFQIRTVRGTCLTAESLLLLHKMYQVGRTSSLQK
jgi:hypothetical protein